jgi:hypothetical protein
VLALEGNAVNYFLAPEGRKPNGQTTR